MSTLVIGGTGTVGSGVVQGLIEQGESVSVLTRSKDKVASLPAGATGVVGDLQDPSTFEEIFSGVDRMFLLNAFSPTELQEGLSAVNEASRVGAERIVYLSIHDIEKGPNIPHFASKIAVEAAIRATGIPYTMVRASLFYQNDVWLKDAVLGYSVYPMPIGNLGISAVDTRDVSKAAVNVLTQPGHENKSYSLVGPQNMTGESWARAYADTLDREISYGGDDLDAWQEQALQMLPAWAVYDIRLMHALFQKKGFAATDAQLGETKTVLGGEPRPLGDFVEETVASWQ
jgi:uncharacterized protein YbjT (DUF2867 family)